MPNFTPAPWNAVYDPAHFDTLSTVIAGEEKPHNKKQPYTIRNQMIVEVGGFSNWQEQEANTRLIAIAPEMYAMLEKISQDPSTIDVEEINALISKANK